MKGVVSAERKKRGRGVVKGLSIASKRVKERTQRLPIEFSNSCGGPIGPNRRAFVDEVVLFTRKWAPLIGVSSWKDIAEDVKEEIATEILVCCVLLCLYFLFDIILCSRYCMQFFISACRGLLCRGCYVYIFDLGAAM
jgi:hypothetical protein